MKSGGYVTGDQHNWGLVTVPPLASDGSEIGRPASEPKLRYSLNPVPRDEATVEAEKGETVLTDLNEDGKFELYKILGRRHTGGGTPLNLPPQSFIYSDTAKSRLPKAQLAELGVSAKKMITPAVASMNFELNPYVGILADPTTDKIGETGAELMLDKNKHSLSHLAFLQESRKKFKEGVPLASHPYLVSQGQDPIEFSMKVEEINRKEAEDAAIAQLPLEEQQKILMLRQFMEQAQTQEQQQGQQQGMQPPMEAQGQPMQQQMQPPPGMAPQGQPMSPEMMARCGGEHRYLPKAQYGTGTVKPYQTPGAAFPDVQPYYGAISSAQFPLTDFYHSEEPETTRWQTKEGKTPFQALLETKGGWQELLQGRGYTPDDTLIQNDPRIFDITDAEFYDANQRNWSRQNNVEVREDQSHEQMRKLAFDMTYGSLSTVDPNNPNYNPNNIDPLEQAYYNLVGSGTTRTPVSKEEEKQFRLRSKATKQFGGEYGYLPKAQYGTGHPHNFGKGKTGEYRNISEVQEKYPDYMNIQPDGSVTTGAGRATQFYSDTNQLKEINPFMFDIGLVPMTDEAMLKGVLSAPKMKPEIGENQSDFMSRTTGNPGWMRSNRVWDGTTWVDEKRYGGEHRYLPKAQDGAEMDYNTWLSKFKETEEYEELWEYYYVKKDELGEGWLENELQKTYRKVFGISANIIPPTDNVFKGVDLDINFKIFKKGEISPSPLGTLSDDSYTTQRSFIQTESVDDDISSGNYETLNISSTQRDGEYDWIWQILEYENEFGADGVTGVANWGWTDPSGKWKKAEAALAQKENRESRFLSDGKVTKQEAYDMFIDFIIPQFDPSFLPGGANYNPQVLKDLASYMFNSSRKYEDVLLRAANVHTNASDLNNPYDPQLWIDNKAKITALMKDSNVVQLVNNAMADAYNTQRGHTLQKPHSGAANWINHRMKKQWNSTGAQATQAQGGPGATGTTEATGATGTTEVTTKKDLNARYQQIEDLYYDPRMEETRNHMYDLFKSKVAQDIKAGKKYASDYKKFANDDKNEYKEEFEEATLRMQKGNLYQQEYYGDDVLKRTEEVSKYNAGAGGKYYNEQLKNAGWTEGEITPYDIGLGQYGFGLMADMQKAGLLKNTLLTISYTGDPKANESSYRSGTGEKISAISNIDRKAGSKTLYENWVINPDTPSLEEEPDGTIPVKPEPLKVPDFIPQSADVNTPFWLQDMIGMGTAISNKYGVNKYYPWAPMINKPSMEPVFDDPTRRIAAINEQKTISDQARAMYSGPQSLAAFTGKSSGQGMKGIADTVDRVNRYNVDTANKFALLNTNMDLSTQQLNNATRTKLYDDTMAVDQNYDNAMIQANTEIAKQIQNAFTNRANTANLNSLFEGYNVHPETGGFVRHTGSPRSIYGTYPRKTREEEVSEIYKNWDRDYPEKDMPSGYLDYILGTQKTRRNNSQYDPYGVYGESAYNENLTDSQIEYLNLIRAGGYQQ